MKQSKAQAKHASHAQTQWIFIAVAVGLAVVDVWLIFWEPGPGSYKSPWAAPAVTFFLLVMIYAVCTMFARRKLVEEMRSPEVRIAPPALAGTEAPFEPPAAGLPMPPLEVLTGERLPPLSAPARELLARSQRIFTQAVGVHRSLVWYLIAANLSTTLLVLALGGDSPLPFKATMYLLAAVPLLSVVANPKRLPNTLTYAGWAILHVLWVGLTLFVAGACVLAAARGVGGATSAPRLAAPLVLLGLVCLFYLRRLNGTIARLRADVLAHPPVRLLFLWVFGSWQRINSLLLGLGALWRVLGPLRLLQGGEFVASGADVFRYLRGRSRQGVAQTPALADARIAKFPRGPSRWACMYSTDMLLCGDESWRHAVTALLEDTDLVLMDLSGFSPDNAGCTYEVGLLIDRVDLCRFLLLVDEKTDVDFLRSTLAAAWAKMPLSSPNRQPDVGPIQLFHLEREHTRDGLSLAPVARNSTRLMHLLCAGATRGRPESHWAHTQPRSQRDHRGMERP